MCLLFVKRMQARVNSTLFLVVMIAKQLMIGMVLVN